jgi:hypothetical protein
MKIVAPFFFIPLREAGRVDRRQARRVGISVLTIELGATPSVTPQEARHLPHLVEKDKIGIHT